MGLCSSVCSDAWMNECYVTEGRRTDVRRIDSFDKVSYIVIQIILCNVEALKLMFGAYIETISVHMMSIYHLFGDWYNFVPFCGYKI